MQALNNSSEFTRLSQSSSSTMNLQKLENSHLIQVTSTRQSLWRGHEQMKLSLSIKVDRRFLKTNLYSYNLIAYLENYKTKELCYPIDRYKNDLVLDLYVKNDFGFMKKTQSTDDDNHESDDDIDGVNRHDCRRANSVEITASDLYYELDVSVPKQMFQGDDQIRVIVEAIPLFGGCSIFIYGASQVITICDLALITENNFFDSEFVQAVDKNTFAWFKNSKFGHSNALRVRTQIKDSNGNPYKGQRLPKMALKTELLYEDDSPAPQLPLCPLRDRQKKNPSSILNRLNGESNLSSKNCPVEFVFRIEEVIFHHSGHKGFKLNVFLEKPIPSLTIHQAPMDDVIVVLSKPRRDQVFTSLQSNPSSNHEEDGDGSDFVLGSDLTAEEVLKLIPPDNEHDDNNDEDEVIEIAAPAKMSCKKDEVAIIPLGAIIDSYRCHEKCYCCNNVISINSFLLPKYHADACIFANQVLPLLTIMGVNQVPNQMVGSNGNRGVKVDTTLGSVVSKFPSFSSVTSKDHSTSTHTEETNLCSDEMRDEQLSCTSMATTKLDLMQMALPSPVKSKNGSSDNNSLLVNIDGSSKNAASGVIGKNQSAHIESHNYEAYTKARESIQNNETAQKRSASPCNPTFFRLKGMKKHKPDSNTKIVDETVNSETRFSPLPFQSHRQRGSEVEFNLELFDFGITLS